MSYVTIEALIEGVSPLLCHNGQLANPLNPWAKAISLITAKGKKKTTDEDRIELARLEFMGGLYAGEKGEPAIPGENIEAMIIQGAQKSRQGPAAKAGIISDGDWPILYDGPKDPAQMWACGNYRKTCGAHVGQATIMRTRPIFHAWKLAINISYLPDVVNGSEAVREWLESAGRLVGLGDWTPRYGRFNVLEMK